MERQQQRVDAKAQVAEVRSKTQTEAKTTLDAVYKQAREICKEAKKLADELYQEAKKQATDKQAKQEADRVHKEALKQADKVRDALIAEANAAFRVSYDEAEKVHGENIAKLK